MSIIKEKPSEVESKQLNDQRHDQGFDFGGTGTDQGRRSFSNTKKEVPYGSFFSRVSASSASQPLSNGEEDKDNNSIETMLLAAKKSI